jgi:hypothetical protein
MAGAVTDEEKPSADPVKRRKLPLLALGTLWVFLWATLVLLSYVACVLFPHATRSTVETDAIMSSIGQAVDAYRQEYGQLPSSVNRDLVDELTGQNAKGTPFMDFSPRRLNRAGEVVDAWGTPLRFEWLDGRSVQITSAGPDRTFGTPDDMKRRDGR